MILPLNGFDFTSLILICRWLLLCDNVARTGIIAGVAVIYMDIE